MNAARFKRSLLLAIVLLTMLRAPAVTKMPLKLLMFGTSLTQGLGLPPGSELPAVLEVKLAGQGIQAKVINAGVSGDTSADGLSRIDWSLADKPDAAIVELGSNDALRGLDPAIAEKNIGAVLAKLQTAHIPALLLGMKAPRNLGTEYTARFDAIYPRLATRYHDILYPFALEGVALDPKLNQADGMHPNPAGVQVIATHLMPYVRKLMAEVLETRR